MNYCLSGFLDPMFFMDPDPDPALDPDPTLDPTFYAKTGKYIWDRMAGKTSKKAVKFIILKPDFISHTI